jgi:transcriptional regulator GlxA family with amidase domain
MSIKSVGVYLFDNVEILDFTGPLQVFSSAQYINAASIEKIETIAFNSSRIKVSKLDLNININRTIKTVDDVIGYDLLIIPGGLGTRHIIQNEQELKIIKLLIDSTTKVVSSVCAGSLILAKLGYLKGLTVTTHQGSINLLQQLEPDCIIDKQQRFIHNKSENGIDFIIAEGVSAGIDMSLYLLERYFSKQLSDDVRVYIEYFPNK